MTNNTANRTFCSNLSIFYRAICNGDISIDRTIIFFIIARSPANQTTNTSTTIAVNRAVSQMAVIQFNLGHRINIVDKCTDALITRTILDSNLSQGQILDNDTRSARKATCKQRCIQASNFVVVTLHSNNTCTCVALNSKRCPLITSQVIIFIDGNSNIA